MKRIVFLWLIGLTAMPLFAQLTLDSCKQMARANYPAVKQYRLIERSRDYTVQNAAKAWLPQVSLSAGGYAFTDVIKMSSETGSMDMKNWVGMASVQVNQMVYDGGATAASKNVARAEADVNTEQLNVSMYDLNGRIDQLYFGILTIDEQLRQLAILQNDLGLSLKTVEAMMRNGTANQSDVDAVNVELVQNHQQELSLQASRQAYATMLGTFIGQSVTASTTLTMPDMPAETGNAVVRRPELDYYTAQGKLLLQQRKSLDARLMPRLSLFGMASYHSTVTQMAKNSILAAGLTLSWNVGALYTRKNDLHLLALQQSDIDAQREVFLFNNRLENEQTNGETANLRQQIREDEQIIALRERIRQKSEMKVQNGTETVNELLRNVNAVSRARQDKALHQLQLLQQLYNLREINNN